MNRLTAPSPLTQERGRTDSPLSCGAATGLTCTTNGGSTDERRSSIDPLTGGALDGGRAPPTSRSRRAWSADARARSVPSRSDNPSPFRRMSRARSLTSRIRPRRSRRTTPVQGSRPRPLRRVSAAVNRLGRADVLCLALPTGIENNRSRGDAASVTGPDGGEAAPGGLRRGPAPSHSRSTRSVHRNASSRFWRDGHRTEIVPTGVRSVGCHFGCQFSDGSGACKTS